MGSYRLGFLLAERRSFPANGRTNFLLWITLDYSGLVWITRGLLRIVTAEVSDTGKVFCVQWCPMVSEAGLPGKKGVKKLWSRLGSAGLGPAFAGSYGAAGSSAAKDMEGRPALARNC